MSAYKKQVGGKHYIKYILRHQNKGGKEDLLKAKHFIDMIIERDYGDEKEKQETWIEGYKKWEASK